MKIITLLGFKEELAKHLTHAIVFGQAHPLKCCVAKIY
jgi:hypothetical protein